MNRDEPERTDKPCNVCETGYVEVGSAWSRCSNRDCPTRSRDNNLSTDASDEEIADYWQERALDAEQDGPGQDEVDEAVRAAYKAFKTADDHEAATQKNGAVQALMPLSSYSGWGDLRMEADA